MSDLSDQEAREVAAMRAAVLEHVPGVRALIAELVQEGLIAGWRNITYVGPPRRRGVSAHIYLENSYSLKVMP